MFIKILHIIWKSFCQSRILRMSFPLTNKYPSRKLNLFNDEIYQDCGILKISGSKGEKSKASSQWMSHRI